MKDGKKKSLGRQTGRSFDEPFSPYSESSSLQHSSCSLFSISCCSSGAAGADSLSSWRCASCTLLLASLISSAQGCHKLQLAVLSLMKCHTMANDLQRSALMREAPPQNSLLHSLHLILPQLAPSGVSCSTHSHSVRLFGAILVCRSPLRAQVSDWGGGLGVSGAWEGGPKNGMFFIAFLSIILEI